MVKYPEKVADLTPQEAMKRMRWCDRDDIYVLNGGIEKRMSTLSQQFRAVSLVGALIKEKIIKPETRIVIIGAGIAGLTAAATALTRGCKNVEVYEKGDRIAPTYEKSERLIDPRLYEWPTIGWTSGKAELPLLDWDKESGKVITENLRAQWTGWEAVFEKTTGGRPNIGRLNMIFNKTINPNQIKDGRSEFADKSIIKIVAIGFGKPKFPNNLEHDLCNPNRKWEHDYWKHHPEKVKTTDKIGVIGAGDGGLAVAISYALRQAGNKWIEQKDIRRLLEAIDDKSAKDIEEKIFKYDTLEDDAGLEEIGEAAFDKAINCVGFNVRNTAIPVQLFIRSEKGAHPNIGASPFRLNRWLVVQLVRLNAIKLIAIPKRDEDNKGVEINNGSGYSVTASDGKSKQVDQLFIQIGQKVVEGWDEFIQDFRNYIKTNKTSYDGWEENKFYQIAVLPPDKPEPETRYFYSDLYDSTTQRAVLDALLAESRNLIDAENELVRLYERRFLLEIARRDCVMLSDNQVFDGAFFLRWLSKIDKKFLTSLLTTVRIGSIRVDQMTKDATGIFDKIVSKNKTHAREFEFSSIVYELHRNAITTALREGEKSKSPLTGINGMPAFLKDQGVSAAARAAWDELAKLHGSLIRVLEAKKGKKFLKKVDFTNYKFDHPAAIEDPGEFLSRNPCAKELMEYAFSENKDKNIQIRTAVYEHFNQQKINRAVEPTRNLYDRSYNRAIGFQHALAAGDKSLVFETVNTIGLPKFTSRDGIKPINTAIVPLKSDTRELLMSMRKIWEQERRCARPHPCGWADTASSISAEVDKDLGKRALALLRGATKFRRTWTKEAVQVGPRVPAVIDEESYSDVEPPLNRVEYFGDIPL